MKNMTKCLCGCEQEANAGRKYIQYHGRIHKKPWNYGLSKQTDERVRIGAENTSAAQKGRIIPEETREKMRVSAKKKVFSESHRENLSKAGLGKIYSDERRKNIGNGLRGIKHGPISEQTKINMSKAGKGKHKMSEIHKLIIKQSRAKQVFPLKDTKIEKKIQGYLQQLQVSFVSHKHISEIEHSYQCDIFVPQYNLVIECDGNYWHNYPDGTAIDMIRTMELIHSGYKVLRLWESEVNKMTIEEFRNRMVNING